MTSRSGVLLWLIAAPFAVASAQRQCKKGIPCGGSCISANKTCHVGTKSPDSASAATNTTTLAAALTATSPARLDGDVYWIAQNGDVKRGAGLTVTLLRDHGGLIDSVRSACTAARLENGPLRVWLAALIADTERIARNGGANVPEMYDVVAREERLRRGIMANRDSAVIRSAMLLNSTIVDSAKTGMNAHFVFPSLAPGKYVLRASSLLGGGLTEWLAPIELRGTALTRDLDPSALFDDPTCQRSAADVVSR